MRKRMAFILAAVLLMIMSVTVTGLAADQDAAALTIRGDGVTQEVTFSVSDLRNMSSGISQNIYSATNNFPTDKVMYRKGVSLQYLLRQAGLKDNAQQIKFTSSDGYSRTFTCQELLQDDRYYFDAGGARTSVPAMIAFADSSKGFDSLNEIEPTLTMGQRVKGEQNNPWFVKYVQTIEVITAPPQQWPAVTFARSEASNGIYATLNHSSLDMVKIYYTLDGTDPTIHSTVYNVSASYYQPQLNKPILITKDTTIKAVAVGAGKSNSQTSSTTVSMQSPTAPEFTDLEQYEWAAAAIQELSRQGVINGMGNAQFAPGEPLTRAQFATIIVLALGESPVQGTVRSFFDVKTTDWHYGYVEKAARLGLITGYPDQNFRPDQTLSRQEMLTIVVKAAGQKAVTAAESLQPFAGETRISDWARGYVACAENIGILEHGHMAVESSEGLSFDALREASRAEAAVTVHLMLNRSPH